MPSSTTIPLTTLPVGETDVGPASVADADSQLTLTLSRLVTGGLESLTSSTVLGIFVSQSDDSGATWTQISGMTVTGGHQVDRTGATLAAISMNSFLIPGATGRLLKAAATVSGPDAVAVSGTLTSA